MAPRDLPAHASGGIVVYQPPHTLALAQVRRLPNAVIRDVDATIGGVWLVDHGAAMLSMLHEHAPNHHALVVPDVGVIVWGAGLRDAVYRAEALEYAAQMTIIANYV